MESFDSKLSLMSESVVHGLRFTPQRLVKSVCPAAVIVIYDSQMRRLWPRGKSRSNAVNPHLSAEKDSLGLKKVKTSLISYPA